MTMFNAFHCFLIIAGLVVSFATGHAAESSFVDTGGLIRIWRESDGLPSDSVTAIIEGREGFLWIGTSGGLVRFDGVKFTEVKLLGSTNVVRVTALCEDSNGHLWIGTQQNGLFEFHQGVIRRYSEPEGLLDQDVTSLAADNQGVVWIGTKSGLNLYTGRDLRSFTVREGLADDYVSGVHVARSGTVWITTRGGICRFINGRMSPYAFETESQGRSPEYIGVYENRNGNLWAFGDTYLINLEGGKRFNYFRGAEAASARIWSLCEGADGRLWIGTSGRGLYCFDDNRFLPVMLSDLSEPFDVRAICEDRERNLWLGTSSGGLVQLRPKPVHILRSGQGLPASQPTALALDASGRVHVGLQQGGLFAGEAGRFERFDTVNGMDVQEFVSSLCIAADDTVWAGTWGGGLYGMRNGRGVKITTANGLADDAILAVCAEKTGGVWASTEAGTLHLITETNITRFDATNGLPNSPVTTLLAANAGGLWLGTEDGTILRGETGKFHVVQSMKNPVIALFEGSQERLWIGTAGGGLACVADGKITRWNTANGVPNEFVTGLVEDNSRNLWLATGIGIYRISPSDLNKSLQDPSTPLVCKLMAEARTSLQSTVVFGGTRALLSPEGKLWFATSQGVLNVDTHGPEIEAFRLPLYIERIAFNGQPPIAFSQLGPFSTSTNSAAVIAPGDLRSLEIHFTTPSFTAPERIRFRHKLEGFDVDWVDDGFARFVRYGRLPYGRYQFRVAARSADGAWQESVHNFSFEVPTPFYLQAWAITLYGVIAIALLSGIVRVISHRRLRTKLSHLEQQQSLERERMRIARDMHDEIGSKLTKISFLSEHVQMEAKLPEPHAGKIQAIADSSRELLQTMDEIVWVVNPHNDTLEHLVAYLSHYAVEYFQNTNIECDLRLPRTIPHHPLPSEARHNLFLAFEEALNNVLKHSGAKKVNVEMAFNTPELEIKITDDGRGFDAGTLPSAIDHSPGKKREGNGLKNMRQRLAEIGGEFLVSGCPGEGTKVTMRMRVNVSVKKS